MKNRTKLYEYMVNGNMYNLVKHCVDNYNKEYKFEIFKNNKIVTFKNGMYEFDTESDALFMLLTLFMSNDFTKEAEGE